MLSVGRFGKMSKHTQSGEEGVLPFPYKGLFAYALDRFSEVQISVQISIL